MRTDWNQYFMDIATQVATRATCDRKHVGAVLVRDKTILSTGYNGSIRGLPHCDDVGHMMENGHCVATVHAEANAIIQAAKNGVGINGATIYTTASPCWPCFKLIANSGIKEIVFGEYYRDPRVFEYAEKADIVLNEDLAYYRVSKCSHEFPMGMVDTFQLIDKDYVDPDYPLAVISLIFHPDGKRLLSVTRGDEYWNLSLPGGKREPGEAVAYSQQRETKEETDVDITSYRFVHADISVGPRTFKVYAFHATQWEGRPKDSKEGKVAWATPQELTRPGMTFTEYNRKLFKALGIMP